MTSMNFVRFYTIGSLIPILIEIGSDISMIANNGHISPLLQLAAIPGWMWFCVSGIFIVVFILSEVPFWTPLAYVAYYLSMTVIIVILMIVCPDMFHDGKKFPIWGAYTDIGFELALLALNIRLLVTYKPTPKNIVNSGSQ